MKITQNLVYILMTLIFMTKMAHGWDEDDDEDLMGELFIDMVVGVTIAVCESYVTCASFMYIIGSIAISTTLVAWCCEGCHCDRPSNRTVRRFTGVTTGYAFTRSFIN